MRGRVRLSISAEAGKPLAAFIHRRLRQALSLVKTDLRELSVALVGDRRMSELHRRFMNLPGPTDVLTFEIEHDSRGRCVAGETILCVPEARRQARARGVELRHELLLYAIHGLLHLSGFDDRTAAGYRKMHRMEDRILTRLGIGAVFAPIAGEGKRT